MSELWAERQRTTNQLVRSIFAFIINDLSSDKIYGITQLTWITKNFEGENASYIKKTKLSGLSKIFDKDFTGKELNEVAIDVGVITGNSQLIESIKKETGFTNFYNAYRNSSLKWVEENYELLKNIYTDAFRAKSIEERARVVSEIEKLPKIKKPNDSYGSMNPEDFVTPALFCLDESIEMPIINGNGGIQKVLKMHNLNSSSLGTKFLELSKLIGTNGIKDAADLDQVGHDLLAFVSKSKSILKEKVDLPLKDETDIDSLIESKDIKYKRIHNKLTNELRTMLKQYNLYEGENKECMYDILVEKYYNESDLLIEVKSKSDRADIRMAIGQLLDYRYDFESNLDIAILLPECPEERIINLLEYNKIGLMWLDNGTLKTSSAFLKKFIETL